MTNWTNNWVISPASVDFCTRAIPEATCPIETAKQKTHPLLPLQTESNSSRSVGSTGSMPQHCPLSCGASPDPASKSRLRTSPAPCARATQTLLRRQRLVAWTPRNSTNTWSGSTLRSKSKRARYKSLTPPHQSNELHLLLLSQHKLPANPPRNAGLVPTSATFIDRHPHCSHGAAHLALHLQRHLHLAYLSFISNLAISFPRYAIRTR